MINMKYWVHQKVRSGFSIRRYGKTQKNFLANTIRCDKTHYKIYRFS